MGRKKYTAKKVHQLFWKVPVNLTGKIGNNFLRYGCQQLTPFGIFQDRIMKLSGWAWFLISWSLSKFELILTTFFFIVSKGGTKGEMLKNCQLVFQHFSLETLKKKSCRKEFKFWEALRNLKSSSSYKFHNSILKNDKTSQLSASISEKVVPLCNHKRFLKIWWVNLTAKIVQYKHGRT